MSANSREAAFLAVLSSVREAGFATDFLENWKREQSPSTADYHLAREIAFGTIRMALALDYLAAQLTPEKKLKVKQLERVLIRIALYQVYYMDRIPLYAIVNESVSLAKKYCHPTFVKFLNAILRKVSEEKPALPTGTDPSALSMRYSYPLFFVEIMIQDYGLEKTKEILQLGNVPAVTMARIRGRSQIANIDLLDAPIPIGLIRDPAGLASVAESPNYYIQNVTPAFLIHTLAQGIEAPKKILDLCAAPGGKLIAAHDFFPDAALFANDVSEEKVKILKENCAKYEIDATLSCKRGEAFTSPHLFDVVILDVPCSNSGVLNKRPEARWRLTPQNLKDLEALQWALIKKGYSLLSNNGELWYMTCSILKDENERLIDRVTNELQLRLRQDLTILPNEAGWDGGFACALRKS